MSLKFEFASDGQKGIKEEINWNDSHGAKEMIEAYLNHPNPLKIPDGRPLKSIEICREDLSGLFGCNITKDLVLHFAVSHASLCNSVPIDQQSFTLVMTGTALIDGQEKILTNPVYNKFNPCPDACYPYADDNDRPVGPTSSAKPKPIAN